MRITRVESFLMSYPMAEPLRLPFWNGVRTILKRDAMYVRVTTDTGLQGFAPGPAHERAQKEIHEVIQPLLLGKDPREALVWQPDLPGEPETLKTYRAVEIALLDVLARYEGCPLSDLVGRRVRDRIKLYGSAGMYMSPEGYAAEAAAVQGLGFPAYKMRPALGPERDLEAVERMRAATGPDFGLMIDAHSWWRMGDRSYSFETVADLTRALAAFRPAWLEEPLPPEDHAAYARLRHLALFPIATGEHEPDLAGFQDLVAKGAADILQMDVCCQGGFATGRGVVEAAQASGLRFAFHSWGTTLEVLAAAHFGVCFPEDVVEWLEYPCYANAGRPGMYPFPLADEILAEPLEIQDGHLVVPRGPGLGIDVNERVAEAYPFLPGPWSFFHINSPPETIAVTGDHSVKWVEAAR
jgi:L-alanine-DL-glutamate epimerase-like enolase superfamily enzyme